VTIRGGVLRLGDRQEVGSRNFPIDRLLDSLAEDRTSAAIGIVLSGAAPDGARGLQAIKAGGGLTFAEDETLAGYADFVMPPARIAAELKRIGRDSWMLTAAQPADESGDGLRRICQVLRSTKDVDFLQYRPGIIDRRVVRRMFLRRLESLPEYVEYLRGNPVEIEAAVLGHSESRHRIFP